MSLIAIPFKNETPETVLKNIRICASHPRVTRIVAIGAEEDDTWRAIRACQSELKRETGTDLDVIMQERIGSKRPGKGDAMNTALRWFLSETDLERLHFYDADITSFTDDWITKAEQGADLGYQVVRHYFPRASTDAMVTFLIARTGFALCWPASELPWFEQPLGGELLLTRKVAERFVTEKRIQAQSDWGIDTAYTFYNVKFGFPTYETYRPEGKMHSLYGRLTDLQAMLVECFAAIQDLHRDPDNQLWYASNGAPAGGIIHRVEPQFQVPLPIIEKVGFDIEGTLALLLEGWTEREEVLLDRLPPEVRGGMIKNRLNPSYEFMDEDAWEGTYLALLENFEIGDPDWEALLFKLWTARVLQYTVTVALRGYGFARRYRYTTIVHYLQRAQLGRAASLAETV